MRKAEFDAQGTVVGLSVSQDHQGNQRHSVVYQNAPKNESDGPNAMLLILPGMPMTSRDVLDTERTPKIAQNMLDAIQPVAKGRGDLLGGENVRMASSFEVFNRGIYTMALTNQARFIEEALQQVPINKRPAPNSELMDWLSNFREDWPVLIACFDNKKAKLATPIFASYKPIHSHMACLPALDAHKGKPPQVGAMVSTDHWVIYGFNVHALQSQISPNKLLGAMKQMSKVYYTDDLPKLHRRLLPTHVIGKQFKGREENGDFLLPIDSLYGGNLDGLHRGMLP